MLSVSLICLSVFKSLKTASAFLHSLSLSPFQTVSDSYRLDKQSRLWGYDTCFCVLSAVSLYPQNFFPPSSRQFPICLFISTLGYRQHCFPNRYPLKLLKSVPFTSTNCLLEVAHCLLICPYPLLCIGGCSKLVFCLAN